jgi:hypothetical protein
MRPTTIKSTRHTTPNIDVISRFEDVKIETRKEPGGAWSIEVAG